MSKKLVIVLGVLAVCIVGVLMLKPLLNFNLDGPPQEDHVVRDVALETSVVQTSLKVPLAAIETTVEAALIDLNPIYEGRSDEIATDIVIAYLGLPRREVKTCEPTAQALAAKKAIKCFEDAKKKSNAAKQALAMGKCAFTSGIDNITTALKIAKACVNKISPIPLPSNNTYVDYTVAVDNVQFSSKNDAITAKALVSTELTIPKGLFSALQGNKGPHCGPRLWASATLTPDFTFNNSAVNSGRGHGRIYADLKVGKVEVTPGPACKSGGNKLPDKVLAELDKVILKAVTAAFQKTVREALEDKVNDTVNDTVNDKDNVNTELAMKLDLFRRPLDLTAQLHEAVPPLEGTGLFVALNPEHVQVTKVRTRGRALEIGLGIAAKPVLSTMAEPASSRFVGLKKGAIKNGFSVSPRGKIDLTEAEETVTQIITGVVREMFPKVKFEALEARLYQAGERIVIGLNISGATWLKLDGSLFLTARPTFDPETATIRFEDVKFDAASETFLLAQAAWILETPIEKILTTRLEVSVEPQFEAVLATLAAVCLQVDAMNASVPPVECNVSKSASNKMELPLELKLGLDELALGDIWLSENALNLTVVLSGTSSVEVLK